MATTGRVWPADLQAWYLLHDVSMGTVSHVCCRFRPLPLDEVVSVWNMQQAGLAVLRAQPPDPNAERRRIALGGRPTDDRYDIARWTPNLRAVWRECSFRRLCRSATTGRRVTCSSIPVLDRCQAA
jgi:hypothetical protein